MIPTFLEPHSRVAHAVCNQFMGFNPSLRPPSASHSPIPCRSPAAASSMAPFPAPPPPPTTLPLGPLPVPYHPLLLPARETLSPTPLTSACTPSAPSLHCPRPPPSLLLSHLLHERHCHCCCLQPVRDRGGRRRKRGRSREWDLSHRRWI